MAKQYRLTKSDLGAHLQGLMADAGIRCSKERSIDLVSELLEYVANSVANGYSVTLHNFGTFEPRFRKATVRNNPQDPTGTVKIQVPETYAPGFRAYTHFKEMVATYEGEAPYGVTPEQECETGECQVEA